MLEDGGIVEQVLGQGIGKEKGQIRCMIRELSSQTTAVVDTIKVVDITKLKQVQSMIHVGLSSHALPIDVCRFGFQSVERRCPLAQQ